jgi:signal transduction histidine kinase
MIHFTAVELASPENVHLQYRLDGVDPTWLDADPTRTALYTGVPAGVHTFHVRASNGDGIWDRAGINYEITQEPYFYQASWFWASIVAVSAGLLAILYVLRVRQITGRLQSRLEERISERERIARELHDTLLQGFHGLILRIHGAAKSIPADQPARGLIEQVLNRADEVMDEARDRVRDLRVNHNSEGDLAHAFSLVAEEFADGRPTAFELIIEGTPRNLHPIVHDELCQIGREALLNAFSHANARKIYVEIIYNRRELRLRFKDDGCGIKPGVLGAGGRPAHWGLRGMRERSKKIGARLDLRSRLGAGTEVELVISSATAYKLAEGARKPWFLSGLRG